MFKLVILNNHFESIKAVCNCIINQIADIQISGICTNFSEFEELCKKINPDIVMLKYADYIHSDFYNNTNCKKLVIIFGKFSRSYKNTSTQLFISENTDINIIIETITNFISKYNTLFIRKKIIDILDSYCFDFKLIGTTYLLESILYCYENKTKYVFENLEKNVYPHIAKMYGSSVHNIKLAIVRTIDTMNTNVHKDNFKHSSNRLEVLTSEKTTAKQLISTIVTKL